MNLRILLALVISPLFLKSQEIRRDTLQELKTNIKIAPSNLNILNSFWGIPFGSSLSEARKLKPEIEMYSEHKNGFCFDCNFGKFKGTIMVSFNDAGLMSGGIVILKPTEKDLIFELYDDVVQNIKSKYGVASKRNEEFSSAYQDNGFGRKYPSLSIPTSDVYTSWLFNSSIKHEDDAVISVTISRDFEVKIVYVDLYLERDSNTKKSEKEFNDY